MAVLIAAAAIVGVVLAFLAGYGAGLRANLTARLTELGLTRTSATLYRRAMKLLHSLITVTDLDGPFGADIMSDPTRQRIEDLLADYRKETKKL